MSLSEIKQKEKKGKKNQLPKLRTILANPYKHNSPVLPENEILEFENILKAAISDSAHSQKTFATKTHIHLGLESSLRAINGSRFSCVFISLSLRPTHLIRLIATSAAAKIPTAPIYAQPKLEELTYELFGVRALALVLPLDLNKISSELEKWVNARKKPAARQKVLKVAKNRKPKIEEEIKQVEITEPQVVAPTIEAPKEWSGDYISCANDGDALKIDQVDVQVETQQLGAALSNLLMKSETKPTKNKTKLPATSEIPTPTIEPMDVDEADEDEFLPTDLLEYQPLTVHQIRANPDKKPKKKRNKKKKNQQQPPNKTN